MTMHLEGPWLSTTGKRRGKQKFRNADEARKARELQELWQQNNQAWLKSAPRFSKSGITGKTFSANEIPSYKPPPGRESPMIPSLPFTGDACTKGQQQVYTGTKVKGIGTLHKSNAVPIFSDEEAVEIARMRR